ncbi:putative S-methyl-5'-thioinosine phosphorylase [Methanobacterium sp. MB1]|uniref:S-methyl-5'-thioadenosine phosphorylase n=1 Tax=uncultured Methanobacterium sp. TaxID=176306 RepID=UPI0003C9A8BC|nr:S-methyl-5'-thioadenosine phosphorylase [uncultured Methanobacterium sp.]CDG65537.1 putative S-methyl-5'-thioinosine phosphorylase [Methanobacterium sp. MB1]
MIGIIGGTGVYQIVELGDLKEKKVLDTPFGESPQVSILNFDDHEVAFIPRHSEGHDNPPHMINYRANVYALKMLGVDRIIATNAVGSLDESIKPGDFLLPDDFLDFTRKRPFTFYDEQVVHVDVTQPYCPELTETITQSAQKVKGKLISGGVYVCTEGPRFETPAEIKMFRHIGGTVVGMTGLPEVVLARELEMCYASICLVSNYAASVSPDKITIDEVFEMLEEKKKSLTQLIYNSIMNLPGERNCPCQCALEGAEVD